MAGETDHLLKVRAAPMGDMAPGFAMERRTATTERPLSDLSKPA